MAGRRISIVFIVFFCACNLTGQSLKRQLEVYSGEVMSESQFKELRIIGKKGSAANDHVIASGNTSYKSSDGLYYPQTGYAWSNLNSGDYSVIKLPYGTTLPPYDKNALRAAFEDSDSITCDIPTLTAFFTYNYWQNISIRDRSNLDEFHGIQRTFNAGETVRIIWSYAATGANKLGLSIFTFTVEVINFDTGEVIARKRYKCDYPISSLDRLWNYYTVSLGNKIPPGNYRVTLYMERAFQVKPSDISLSFLSERFEVLPMMPQNHDMLLTDVFL